MGATTINLTIIQVSSVITTSLDPGEKTSGYKKIIDSIYSLYKNNYKQNGFTKAGLQDDDINIKQAFAYSSHQKTFIHTKNPGILKKIKVLIMKESYIKQQKYLLI